MAKKKRWIQKAFRAAKRKGTTGRCTGSKYGSASCPPGSKAYAMATTLRKMNRKRKKKQEGGIVDDPKTYWSGVDSFKPISNMTAQAEFKRLGIPYGLSDIEFADTLKALYPQHMQPYQMKEDKYFKNFGVHEEFDSKTRKRTGRKFRYNDPRTGIERSLPEYGWGGAAGGAFGGAATGAAIGSAIPVIGTAIGAIGGALFGGLTGHFGEEKADRQQEAALRAMQQSEQQSEEEEFQPQEYSLEYAPTIQMCRGGRARGRRWKRGQKGWRRPYGGLVPDNQGTPLEIEKDEVAVSPYDYSMFQANLPSHANATAANQMSFTPGTMLYSPNEKIKEGRYKGKTYAKAAAKVKRNAESPFTNEIGERTTKRSLDNIFAMQENEKTMKAQRSGKVLKAQGGLYTPVSRDRMMSGYYQNMSNRNQGRGQNILGSGFNWGDVLGGVGALGSMALPAYNLATGYGPVTQVDPQQFRNPYEQQAISLAGEKPRYDTTPITDVYRTQRANIPKLGAAPMGATYKRLQASATGEARDTSRYLMDYQERSREQRYRQAQMMADFGSEHVGTQRWAADMNWRAKAARDQYRAQGYKDLGLGIQNWQATRNKKLRDKERLAILRELGYIPEGLYEDFD